MKPALFAPRTLFIATVTMIFTLTVCGWGFWSYAARQYNHIIDHWIDAGRAAGYQISYDNRQLFGFPRRITMRLVNLHWKNADGIDFHTDDMDIVVTPWDWNIFDAKVKNHVVVTAPMDADGHALTLASGGGHVHVRLDKDGVWRAAELSLDDSKFGLAPAYLFQADRLSASVARPDTPPKDHSEVGLSLTGEADDITLPDAMPAPFGTKAAKVTAQMRVMGAVPDVRKRAAVDAWNKDSGIVEFDDLSIEWGVLNIASKGTLGFDDDLQPEGAFAGTVINAQQTMRTLIDKGFIATHDQDILAAIMDMFAQPLPKGAKGMQLPITVQLGGLFFGPIRLFTFPPIEWPVEPPGVAGN